FALSRPEPPPWTAVQTAVAAFKAGIPLAVNVATAESHPVSTDDLDLARLNSTNRLGGLLTNQVQALFGTPAQRRLAQAALQIDKIRYWEKELSRLSDAELHKRGLQFRGRARGGESLDQLLPEAFGAVCVAALRTTKLRPFDVQLAGGVVLHRGALAELATGEGKTLVATMPTFLNALAG